VPVPELKLKWRRTWPDQDNDFVAMDDRCTGNVGRIYRHTSIEERWQWFLQAFIPGVPLPVDSSGLADTAREAAAALEAAWFRMIGDT
jgi:hypothetical protein